MHTYVQVLQPSSATLALGSSRLSLIGMGTRSSSFCSSSFSSWEEEMASCIALMQLRY